MLNKHKKILSVIYLLFFVSLLVYVGGGLNKVVSFSKDTITSLFSRRGYQASSVLKTQKLVDEESAIIDVVDKVSPSVVSVVVKSVEYDFLNGPTLSESGIGTGFIVDPNGLIVTNSHVVNNPSGEYSVVLKDGTTYEVDKIHLDRISDLAILEVTARGLPAVELGDSDSLKVGQRAVAIGNALGQFQNTVTSGIISGISRELEASSGFGEVHTYEGAIQTDAALNPGNSGGPLLNLSGQVVGINVATTPGADNISFAIPVNTLKPILEGFLEKGRIVKPYLWVSYTMITKALAALRNLPQGAFVARVYPDTPAESAGMQRGDIIVTFGERKLDDNLSLAKAILEAKIGDKMEVVVNREDKELTLPVVLVESPED